MRLSYLFGLGLTLVCFASCRQRNPIEPETTPEDNPAIVSESAESQANQEAKVSEQETENWSEVSIDTVQEVPIAMQPPSATQRIESLSFAHSAGMCVQINADGQANLQACDDKATGQKFLFARSLDGRIQLKDTSSQRCLAVGPIGFFTTVLRGEVCESKSSQFFSVVDYGATYSLKFDTNNTCIDAEQSRAEAGTRLILYRCSAVLNQKIQLTKP